jgi:hypothetical protein
MTTIIDRRYLILEAHVMSADDKPLFVTIDRTPGHERTIAYGEGFTNDMNGLLTSQEIHDLACPVVDVTAADKHKVHATIVMAMNEQRCALDHLLLHLAELGCVLSFPMGTVFHITTVQAKQ